MQIRPSRIMVMLGQTIDRQTSPKSSVHAFDFRDVTERHLINMQKRAIGELRGIGTRLMLGQ